MAKLAVVAGEVGVAAVSEAVVAVVHLTSTVLLARRSWDSISSSLH